nr:unnamed protein product [Spirometra erinaceieuropaei]
MVGPDLDTEVLVRTGILKTNTMLRQLELRQGDHLARMDDERLSKHLFYGYVATGTCRKGGQKRLNKDTSKNSLKLLQISQKTCEDLAQNKPAWTKEMKIGAAIYGDDQIVVAKAKEETQCTNNLAASNPSTLACASNPATTLIPATDDHTDVAPPLSIIEIIRPPSTPASTTATSTAHSAHWWNDSRRLITISITPPHLQLRGLGPNLFSSRSHIHLTHQPDWSLVNSSHRD